MRPACLISSALVAAIALLALAFLPLQLTAQQAYPSSPYGAYASPYSSSPYPAQYAQPSPQYGYGEPQYQQPQYGYAQPQYSAPQQPYTQQPYAQQPYAQQQPYAASPYPQQQDLAPQPAAPIQALGAADLEQLLAPIALYPDSLLAQILAASTYPAQVAVADQWLNSMRSQGYSSPDQIAAGANAQTSWDPSVKALTAFPDVLDMMDHNLEWTTNLGNAYYNQPQDVMQTVQVLRQRAEQAGNLQSTPQEDVTNNQGYIELAPANPQVVYVPTYDPWDVYGQPVAPYPGFSLIGALGSFFGSSPIQYGLGFAMSAFDRTPFGLLSWGLDWLAQAVLFDHSCYYTHSDTVADWGLPYGGPRAYYGRGGPDRMRDGPYRSFGERQNYNQRGEYGRGASGYDHRGGRGYNQHGEYGYNHRGDQGNNPRGGPGYNQRGQWNSNNGGGQSNLRPAQPVRGDPGAGGFNRGFQSPAYGYTHPAMPTQRAYDRVAPKQNYGYRPQTYPDRSQSYSGRPQSFSNPGYGYGYVNRSTNAYSGQAYGTRPGFAYSNPSSSYRAPQPNPPRAFTGRSYGGYGNSMARSAPSGGFHLFGHSQQPKGFSSSRAPKYSFGGGHAPKSSGGGHASRSFGGFGGGHQSAPRASHSGGGGGGHRHF